MLFFLSDVPWVVVVLSTRLRAPSMVLSPISLSRLRGGSLTWILHLGAAVGYVEGHTCSRDVIFLRPDRGSSLWLSLQFLLVTCIGSSGRVGM